MTDTQVMTVEVMTRRVKWEEDIDVRGSRWVENAEPVTRSECWTASPEMVSISGLTTSGERPTGQKKRGGSDGQRKHPYQDQSGRRRVHSSKAPKVFNDVEPVVLGEEIYREIRSIFGRGLEENSRRVM
jgi:hypothetical protein